MYRHFCAKNTFFAFFFFFSCSCQKKAVPLQPKVTLKMCDFV